MARSNLLVPAERKKNFTFFSPFREGRIREILLIAAFSRPPVKHEKRLERYDPSVTPE